MNKENAHLYLPLVQALVDGNDVQWRNHDGEWFNSEPDFTDFSDHYRIKPKPLEVNIWVNDANNTPLLHPQGGIQNTGNPVGMKSGAGVTVRLFREVL